MSVTRDRRNGTWYVQAWYKTYDGKRAHKVKRGFKTKPEALAWERDFYAVQAGEMDMKLVDFLELYKKDMGPRLRLNTWKTKESIITKRILPYLGEKRMNQIAPVDIVRWQNELMALEKPSGGGFSATYLKTVNNQLCALFNHAVRFYGLSSNPCRRAESMGSKSAGEMRFWTKDQYLRFSDEIMDKPLSFHAFETLYWCGVRKGELLALKPRRFDFERGTLTVAESYQRIDGQDVLTDPKTPKSKRVIAMPRFYAEEMEAFLSGRGLDPDERIFPVTKHFLGHEMVRGSKAAGLEPIRIHDLRQPRFAAHRHGLHRARHRGPHGPRGGRHHLPLRPPVPQRPSRHGPRPGRGEKGELTCPAPTPPARGASPSASASRPSRPGASTSWPAPRA